MKTTLLLTLFIGIPLPLLHAEPTPFPAKNALVLEGADLVTPAVDNWEVSWPACTEKSGTLSVQTEVIEKGGSVFPLEDYSKTTRSWWTYGSFTFEQTSFSNSPAGMMARHAEGSIFKVCENEELIRP